MDILTQKGNVLVVALPAEIDHHGTRILAERMDEILLHSEVSEIVFDFSETLFMDSSGIGLIVGRYRKVKSLGGRVVLTGVSPKLARVLRLSGIEKVVGRVIPEEGCRERGTCTDLGRKI